MLDINRIYLPRTIIHVNDYGKGNILPAAKPTMERKATTKVEPQTTEDDYGIAAITIVVHLNLNDN
jgi:hypothetical protein